ncbi:hypothetical protein AVEN_13912-1 [Araneus ventricosus]|uniref:Uncharacterized protein n=1 Tax=Araneus ventricosus TaxID=182803 RepID=A0A4Y2HW40_ARAVE|nr:hypothetical protein AVEN_13912-1 [Araneus ventricosus]
MLKDTPHPDVILVCSSLALQICKLTGHDKECKCEQACSKLTQTSLRDELAAASTHLPANAAKTEYKKTASVRTRGLTLSRHRNHSYTPLKLRGGDDNFVMHRSVLFGIDLFLNTFIDFINFLRGTLMRT